MSSVASNLLPQSINIGTVAMNVDRLSKLGEEARLDMAIQEADSFMMDLDYDEHNPCPILAKAEV